MILSKQVQKVLTHIESIKVPNTIVLPQEQSRVFYELFAPLAGKKEDVFLIEEQTITTSEFQIPLRIYRPNQMQELAAIVYFHGGWFNSGSLNTHDTPLRKLANQTQALIIAVDYRLAPEFPFPNGLNDCELAVLWVLKNATSLGIDPKKITVAGDSAGGALATSITRKLRKKISAQILIYPVTDNSLSTNSWIKYQYGPILDIESAIQAWQWYLPNSDNNDSPDAIPILADDLEQLPPTFIAIAEHDPLKDEAIQYAEKLKKYNPHIYLVLYKDTVHGFFQMGAYIKSANTLIHDIHNFLNSSNALK